jgi:hypothetical protein
MNSRRFRDQHMRCSQFAFVCLLTLAVAGDCSGQKHERCFSFLLKGDVRISCGGSTEQITHRGDIEQFAVSDAHASLALVTSRVGKPADGVAEAINTTTLNDLKSGRINAVSGLNAVISTCGSIFGLYDSKRQHSGNRDLITGTEAGGVPYTWFRCSADRRVVVGTTSKFGADLSYSNAETIPIASGAQFNFYQFNISSNGSYVVYTRNDNPLCLFVNHPPPTCVGLPGATPDIPSVSDAGEVLVAVETPDTCFYLTASNFSKAPISGAREDACLSIGYWTPGRKSIEIIEPLGRDPQWISFATADLLRGWAARRKVEKN